MINHDGLLDNRTKAISSHKPFVKIECRQHQNNHAQSIYFRHELRVRSLGAPRNTRGNEERDSRDKDDYGEIIGGHDSLSLEGEGTAKPGVRVYPTKFRSPSSDLRPPSPSREKDRLCDRSLLIPTIPDSTHPNHSRIFVSRLSRKS